MYAIPVRVLAPCKPRVERFHDADEYEHVPGPGASPCQGVLVSQDSVSVTKAGGAGATLTWTPLMPAGALVFGVTIKVLAPLTGPTRLSVGDGSTWT
jgi:hypothetical protein